MRVASEPELLARARELAGLSLGELALELGLALDGEGAHAKGKPGALVELALGGGGAAAGPDFPGLGAQGVEVKSVPLRPDGAPAETTSVCTIHYHRLVEESWEGSLARAKLARVLWVPLWLAPSGSIADRVIGRAVLWSPRPEEEAQLRADWTLVRDEVAAGRADALSGRMGVWLHPRPKAAGRADRQAAPDQPAATRRGFYLRTRFTRSLLEELATDRSPP